VATRQIPWARIFAEGVAIVVSILLAFGIQAWWEGRQEQKTEQSALFALRADFLASRDALAVAISVLEGAQAYFTAFQSADSAALTQLGADSADAMTMSLNIALTYDPISSSLDAILSDGRISLLQDEQLREALAGWVRALEDIEENQLDLRTTSMAVSGAMQKHGGPFYFPRLGEDGKAFLPRADGPKLAELRDDEEFLGYVRSHHSVMAGYLGELRPLEARITEILALIDANLKQPQRSPRWPLSD
jgi:hypothetical protein